MAVKHVFADGKEFTEPENFEGFRIPLSKDTEWIYEALLGTGRTSGNGGRHGGSVTDSGSGAMAVGK
jgi:hypothetical protein